MFTLELFLNIKPLIINKNCYKKNIQSLNTFEDAITQLIGAITIDHVHSQGFLCITIQISKTSFLIIMLIKNKIFDFYNMKF